MKTNLKRIRLDLGYTQYSICEALKMNRVTYSNYELGRRPLPVPVAKSILKLAAEQGIEITLEDIYEEDEDTQKPKRGAPKRKLSPEKALREVAKILSSLNK